MPLQIHYIRATIVIPVFSRTEQEAIEIVRDNFEDILTGVDEPASLELLTERPASVDRGDIVWGEAVPEEACRVGELREWLREKRG